MFQEGAVVVLQSVASRHALCVSGGDITGKGIRDAFCKSKNCEVIQQSVFICVIAQFKVHRLPSGNVALQNVGNVDNWLTVYEGKTLGSVRANNTQRSHTLRTYTILQGTGGPYAEFVLHEIGIQH